MSSTDVSLPVTPPVRLERLLWLLAVLLGWAFARVALTAAARATHAEAPAGAADAWVLVPALAGAFELWLIATAVRLRRRRRQEAHVTLGADAVTLPPLGLGRRGTTVRYADIVSVTRRGFGGSARLLLHHRRGTARVPIAQVSERALLAALSERTTAVPPPRPDDV